MRTMLVLYLALLSSLIFTGCPHRQDRSSHDASDPVTRQAEPVRNWLQSIRARDVELFRTVFADRWRPHFERQGFGTMLGVYTTLWEDKLGEFDISELTFEFTPLSTGNGTAGHVTVKRGDQSFPPICVIFEEGCWKVDEL